MIFVKRSFTSFSLFHEHMYYNPKQFYIPCLFIEFLEIPLLSLLYKKSSTTEGSKIFVSRKRYFIRRVFRNACAVNVIACQIIKSKLYACDIWALSRCLWNILALVWIVTFSVWGAEQEILRFFFFFFFFFFFRKVDEKWTGSSLSFCLPRILVLTQNGRSIKFRYKSICTVKLTLIKARF